MANAERTRCDQMTMAIISKARNAHHFTVSVIDTTIVRERTEMIWPLPLPPAYALHGPVFDMAVHTSKGFI